MAYTINYYKWNEVAVVSSVAPNWIQQVQILRNTVALMGEQAMTPLWRSQGTNSEGGAYLSDLFPRSYQSAGLAMAVKAARREYDRRLGTIGRFHLFRLPAEYEEMINSLDRDRTSKHEHSPISFNDGLIVLKNLAALTADLPVDPGPRNAGIFRPESQFVRQLASIYITAFTQSIDVIPYFSWTDS